MKTIKQIADEIGVTKQAVFKRIKKPPLSTKLEPFISTVDGAFMVTVDGEKLIQQSFIDNAASTVPPTKPSTELTVGLQFALQSREREIERLEREIERQGREISRLQERNDELTGALISALERKSFFKRLFGRKGEK